MSASRFPLVTPINTGLDCISLREIANGWEVKIPCSLIPRDYDAYNGAFFDMETQSSVVNGPVLGAEVKSSMENPVLQKDLTIYCFPDFDAAIEFIRTKVNAKKETPSANETADAKSQPFLP